MFNEIQKKVIFNNYKNLFLNASPGSGKTMVLVERIRFLINNKKIEPTKILAITFTKKAALEMKERLKNNNVDCFTFHSFCYTYIKDYLKDKEIIDPNNTPFDKQFLLRVSRYKTGLEKRKPPKEYIIYSKYLNDNNFIDFDDLLLIFLNNFNKIPIKKYEYIFIDEFQDTNNLQYKILKLIGLKTRVLAVGDPDQSIYRFRGANLNIINLYKKEFNAETINMNKNYRSEPYIISFANTLINYNKKREKVKIISTLENQNNPSISSFNTLEDEAKFIINQIKKLTRSGITKKEIAILYRNHKRANILKQLFNKTYLNIYTDDNKINFLTIHESKGLEFKVVFIIGLEYNELPQLKENTLDELEEERRLLYVAITRCKNKLYITNIKYSKLKYKIKRSSFLNEIKSF